MGKEHITLPLFFPSIFNFLCTKVSCTKQISALVLRNQLNIAFLFSKERIPRAFSDTSLKLVLLPIAQERKTEGEIGLRVRDFSLHLINSIPIVFLFSVIYVNLLANMNINSLVVRIHRHIQ